MIEKFIQSSSTVHPQFIHGFIGQPTTIDGHPPTNNNNNNTNHQPLTNHQPTTKPTHHHPNIIIIEVHKQLVNVEQTAETLDILMPTVPGSGGVVGKKKN
jgi:hypothetical protein